MPFFTAPKIQLARPLRILHTADWHLGHRLYEQDRSEEHAAALQWLLDLVEREKVDVVIIAGDVFDIANPSNQAKELYYEFMAGLNRSRARAAVVVGGNHDSPGLLDASRTILRASNLHVIGAARSQVQEQVVKLSWEDNGQPQELVVAAVPYLRERDVRGSNRGELVDDRMAGIRAGIQTHFEEVAAAATAARSNENVPIIATGHLFVGSARDEEGKKSHIYQADENNIDAGRFPACFDYVALGHVHRAQRIDGLDHVQYCGSLVPLTFVEGQRDRSVSLVDINGAGQGLTYRRIPVPRNRPLLRLRGTLEEVLAGITDHVTEWCVGDNCDELTPWAEVRVTSDEPLPTLNTLLQEGITQALPENYPAEALKILFRNRVRLTPAPAASQLPQRDLEEIDVEEVFQLICDRADYPAETARAVLEDFRELRNWTQEGGAQNEPAA